MHGFGPFPNLHHLEDHATVCIIGYIVDGRCVELFNKCWTVSHFLMGNNVYVYKDEDLITDELYQNKLLMSFIRDLGCFGGGTAIYEVNQNFLQYLVNVQLLMEPRSQGEGSNINLHGPASFLVLLEHLIELFFSFEVCINGYWISLKVIILVFEVNRQCHNI